MVEKEVKNQKLDSKITTIKKNTYLSITVHPYLLNSCPKFISFAPYYVIIKPILKKYLHSVISGINWYLINQKPVPKNHFGKHIWFSKF